MDHPLHRRPSAASPLPAIGPAAEPAPTGGLQHVIKAAFDRLVAVLALPALAALALAVMMAVKLDDGGPLFFRQPRLGLHGRRFMIWKFRTMVVDADRHLRADGTVIGDRITRVGRWLRRTSLDEVPQILNILAGEMSLIGPRPLLPMHEPRLDARQRGRFLMRPGVTGLAQINGRNELPWSRRLAYDVEYVERFSLALDLRILAATCAVVLTGRGIVLDRNPEQVDDLPRGEPWENRDAPQ